MADVKETYQKLIDRKYACAKIYDKMATIAYTINALGLKRMLMKMTDENWDDYITLKNRALKVHSLAIYPDLGYAKQILDKINKPTISPLDVDDRFFDITLKMLMNGIRDYEQETEKITGESIKGIEYEYPKCFRQMQKMSYDHSYWVGKINKMEMRYDGYNWNRAFITDDQKRVHDAIKKHNPY